MNYARLKDWVGLRVEDLVDVGVPRHEAEALMTTVEMGAISAEAKARNEDQFLLDFKRLGSEEMGRRYGKTGQAMRKRRAELLRNKLPEVARAVAG
jgi:hypothetical protein